MLLYVALRLKAEGCYESYLCGSFAISALAGIPCIWRARRERGGITRKETVLHLLRGTKYGDALFALYEK